MTIWSAWSCWSSLAALAPRVLFDALSLSLAEQTLIEATDSPIWNAWSSKTGGASSVSDMRSLHGVMPHCPSWHSTGKAALWVAVALPHQSHSRNNLLEARRLARCTGKVPWLEPKAKAYFARRSTNSFQGSPIWPRTSWTSTNGAVMLPRAATVAAKTSSFRAPTLSVANWWLNCKSGRMTTVLPCKAAMAVIWATIMAWSSASMLVACLAPIQASETSLVQTAPHKQPTKSISPKLPSLSTTTAQPAERSFAEPSM